MTTATLYQWPSAAKFGRVIPKNKFYEHGNIATSTRQKFVAEVQRITWAYKLADSTVHLTGSESVPEIQVFMVEAKGEDISDDVLAAIDKSVQFPIVFELTRERESGKQTRLTACHKHLGGSRTRVTAYFTHPWLPADSSRAPLPPVLDLTSLYSALLTPMLPIPARADERLAEATERVGQAQKLEREIASMERRLRNEPQLNRQVEIRRELKTQEVMLAALIDPDSPNSQIDSQKDAEWTN